MTVNNRAARRPTHPEIGLMLLFFGIGLIIGALMSPQCINSNEEIYKTSTPFIVLFFLIMAIGSTLAFLRPDEIFSMPALAVIAGLSIGTSLFTILLLAFNKCIFLLP